MIKLQYKNKEYIIFESSKFNKVVDSNRTDRDEQLIKLRTVRTMNKVNWFVGYKLKDSNDNWKILENVGINILSGISTKHKSKIAEVLFQLDSKLGLMKMLKTCQAYDMYKITIGKKQLDITCTSIYTYKYDINSVQRIELNKSTTEFMPKISVITGVRDDLTPFIANAELLPYDIEVKVPADVSLMGTIYNRGINIINYSDIGSLYSRLSLDMYKMQEIEFNRLRYIEPNIFIGGVFKVKKITLNNDCDIRKIPRGLLVNCRNLEELRINKELELDLKTIENLQKLKTIKAEKGHPMIGKQIDIRYINMHGKAVLIRSITIEED